MKFTAKKNDLIYASIICLCLLPIIPPALALVLGFLISLAGIKSSKFTSQTSFLLQSSIVLMGFGMSLSEVIKASQKGFIITAISVTSVMTLGYLLGKLLKVDSKITTLISAGTAICGGSAIAAMAPVIKSKDFQTSFSLVVIFTLNAIALILFPILGHHFGMSQEVFGNWAAIAIHDTSSVVGAGATYGDEALKIATTVKLIRALWIIPLTIVVSMLQKDKSDGKIKYPWFIGLFVIAILIANFIPEWSATYAHFTWLGKRGMVVALFLIGTKVTISEAKKAGPRSFALGVSLWIIISIGSFLLLR